LNVFHKVAGHTLKLRLFPSQMITNNNWYYFIVSIVSIVQPIPIINNIMMTWQNWLLYSLGQAWKLLAKLGGIQDWDMDLLKKILFLVKFLAKTNGNFGAYRLNENFLKNGRNFSVYDWIFCKFLCNYGCYLKLIYRNLCGKILVVPLLRITFYDVINF